MINHKKVLIVDDDDGVRRDFLMTLERRGFEVVAGRGCNSGWRAFLDQKFDLVMLDLIMPDFDGSDAKKGGISLLKRIRAAERDSDRHTPIWILSATVDAETERAMLELGASRCLNKAIFHQQAAGLLAELGREAERSAETDQPAESDSGTAEPASVRGSGNTGPAESQRPDPDRASDHPVVIQAAEGLKLGQQYFEVFRGLFEDCSLINVSRLASGRSRLAVFRVDCRDRHGQPTLPFVAKVGQVTRIEQEHGNFQRYVQYKVGAARHSEIVRKALSQDGTIGGLRMAFAGTNWGGATDFGGFFRQSSVEQVCLALEDLFEETLGRWQRRKQPARPFSVIEAHDVIGDINRLRGAMNREFKELQGQQLIDFEEVPKPFFEPAGALEAFASAYSNLMVEMHFGTIHGDLNSDNILVDGNNACWMFDFETTGEGPMLRDCIVLEVSIKYGCLEHGVEDLWALDKQLLSQEHFRQEMQWRYDDPLVEKAFYAVTKVREYAAMLNAPTRDMTEYYVGLLYYTLKLLLLPGKVLDTRKRKAILLAAAKIFDRFKKRDMPLGFVDGTQLADYPERLVGEPPTILIVDDEEGQRTNLAVTLEREDKFRTVQAASSRKAVETMQQLGNKVSLCVIDMQMESLNGQHSDTAGLDLLRRLKVDYPFMPIVVLSGITEQGPAVSAVHHGAIRFVNKADVVKKAKDFRNDLEKIIQNAQKESQRRKDDKRALGLIRSSLAKRLPEVDGLEYGLFFESLQEVGGDVYDLAPAADGKLGVMVGDATGHDRHAAVLIAQFAAFYQALGMPGADGLSQAFEEWNRFVHGLPIGEDLITLFVGNVDLESRILTYVNAGHVAPFLVSASGDVRELRGTSQALGFYAENDFPTRQIPIAAGDVLVVYSDGFPEAENRSGEEYGVAQLKSSVAATKQLSAEEIKEAVLDAFHSFAAQDRIGDDRTLMVIKLNQIGAGPSAEEKREHPDAT